MEVDELQRTILQILPLGDAIQKDELHTRLMRAFRCPVPKEEMDSALAELEQAQEVAVQGNLVRRTEPDFPERQLEVPVQDWLFGDSVFASLKLDRKFTVCQRTASGGKIGSGVWSRPDFTIATIRRRKYDPIKHLDVIAFELKNVAGTQVVAVHEALAHTRFAHYAYLVCPRSSLHTEKFKVVEQSCAEHGIGLMTFRIGVGPREGPVLRDARIELLASRRTPDPDLVDQFIDDRFSPSNSAELGEIAGNA